MENILKLDVQELTEIQTLSLLKGLWEDLRTKSNKHDVPEDLPIFLNNIVIKQGSKKTGPAINCCIAEVIRLWDPQVPFTDKKIIENVFTFYLNVLHMLYNPNNEKYEELCYIFKCMASSKKFFKSCLEIDEYDKKFNTLFQLIFQILRHDHFEMESEALMSLSYVLQTFTYIPENLLNIVLKYRLMAENGGESKENVFASNLIRENRSLFQRSLYEIYFDFFMLGMKRPNYNYYKVSSELLYNLFLWEWDIVLDIIPLLERKLRSENENERLEMVTFFGTIFQSTLNIPQNYRSLWTNFLKRFHDRKFKIVLEVVKCAALIALCHHDLLDDILTALTEIQSSRNEIIRHQVVRCLAVLVDENLEIIVNCPKFWLVMKERVNDNQDEIRHETLSCLGKVYNKSMNQMFILDKTLKNVQWAGEIILYFYLHENLLTKLLVERIFHLKIVPYKFKPEERMSRLLKILLNVNEFAFKAFIRMKMDQFRLRKALSQWIMPVKENGDYEKMNNLSKEICNFFPNNLDTSEQLMEFHKFLFSDENLLQEFKGVINPASASHALASSKIILSYFDQDSEFGEFVSLLLQRVTASIVDSPSLKSLMMQIERLQYGQKNNDNTFSPIGRAMEILKLYAVCFHHLYFTEDILSYLASFIHTEQPEVLSTLVLLAPFPKIRDIFIGISEKHEIVEFCLNSLTNGPPSLIKHGINLLSTYFSNNKAITDYMFKIMDRNLNSESKTEFSYGLIALRYLMINFTDQTLETNNYLEKTQKIIFDPVDDVSTVSTTEAWCKKSELPASVMRKILAMKVYVQHLLLLKKTEDIKKSIIHFLDNKEKILSSGSYSKVELLWIDTSIGCSVMKLCNYYNIKDSLLPQQLQFLSQLILTSHEGFQKFILERLTKYMLRNLPLDFIGLYCLFLMDSDSNIASISYEKYCSLIKKKKEQFKSTLDSPKTTQQELDLNFHGNTLMFSIITLSLSSSYYHEDTNIKYVLQLIMKPLMDDEFFSFSYYTRLLGKLKTLKIEERYRPINSRLCNLASRLIRRKRKEKESILLSPILPSWLLYC